jgi:bifunctional non-homologous end joining protein LigD
MIAGKKVVVTGVIPGHSRETAQQLLRAHGAFVQNSVVQVTDILVTGARVGATKINKARDLGVTVITWDDLWEAEEKGLPLVASPTPAPATKAPARRQVGPMLAKAGDLPIGERWRYEVKWDGYRCVATVKNGDVHMASRSDKTNYTTQFPAIADALRDLPDCVIDGELVAFEADGTHSFAGMSNGAQAVFMVFDLIEFDIDMRGEAWSDRRKILEALADLHFNSPLLVLSPVFEDGEALLEQVVNRGLEGVVAKPVDSGYREGSRKEWVKVKVRSEQEFVVVGWTDGKGNLAGEIGALMLGVYDESGELVYVGKVGTGKDLAFWQGLKARLDLHPVDEAPVDVSSWAPADRREAYWVVPELVVQVRFQRWTEDGRLWHPSLQGVREDKEASEVRR